MTPTFDLTDWQLFVYILFSMLMVFSAWQGWLHGLGRTTLTLFGVVIGYFLGKALGFLIYDIYEPFIPYPEPIIKVCADVIFAFLVYLLFLAGAMFMFKSTRKQETFSKKLVSGIGGVVMGIANGVVFTILLTILLKFFGILNLDVPPEPGSIEYRQKEEVFLPEHQQNDQSLVANLYRAVSKPPIEKWVNIFDPVSQNYYKLLLNMHILSQREDLHAKFMQTEQIVNLLASPEIQSHVNFEQIEAMIEQRDYHAVLKSEDVRGLFESPSAKAILMEVDWITITDDIIENSDLANHPDL